MKHLLLATSFNEFWMNWRGFILTQFIGLVLGLLIGFFIRFRSLGILMSVILACVGSYCFDYFLFPYFKVFKDPVGNEIVACATGAVVVSLVINLIFGSNRGKDRTPWRS